MLKKQTILFSILITLLVVFCVDFSNVFADTTPTFIRSFTSGHATAFFYPEDSAIDSSGNIYVVDSQNHRIVKLTAGGVFVTSWGTEGLGDGQFEYPTNIAVGNGDAVYVCDYQNNRIQKFTAAGVFVSKWGKGGGNGAVGSGNGEFNGPTGITTDASGNVYVADQGNNRIEKFDENGNFLTSFGTVGSGDGEFMSPNDVAVGATGNIFVADTYNYRVQKLNAAGVFQRAFGSNGAGDGQFAATLMGIAVDEDDNTYVSDSDLHRVQKFDANGNFVLKFGKNGGDGNFGSGNGEFDLPFGLAFDSDGYLYVADIHNARIQKFLVSVPASSAPSTTVQAASSITASGATLNGMIVDTGSTSTVLRGFNYGITNDLGTTTTEASASFATGTFSAVLSNLSCNTTYYFRAYATNAVGTATSSITSFLTSACPVVSSGDANGGGGGTVALPIVPRANTISDTLKIIVKKTMVLSPDVWQLTVKFNGDEQTVSGYSLATTSDFQFASVFPYSPDVVVNVPSGTTRMYGYYYSPTGHTSLLLKAVVPPPEIPPANKKTPLVRTVMRGSVGEDVRYLQRYLNTHGMPVSKTGVGSFGHETTYFGLKTEAALRRFQEQHASEITPPPKKGVLDVGTRAYILAN